MAERKTSCPELGVRANHHLSLHAFFSELVQLFLFMLLFKVFLVFRLKKKKCLLEKCKGKYICGLAKED